MRRRGIAPAWRADRGFTLIEALVALTLFALLAGALMPLFQQGLAVLERGDTRIRAVMLAQGLLEEHAVGDSADRVGETSGSESDFTWQVTREPYDPAADGGPAMEVDDPQVVLVRVSAGVQWEGSAGGVKMSTLVVERVE